MLGLFIFIAGIGTFLSSCSVLWESGPWYPFSHFGQGFWGVVLMILGAWLVERRKEKRRIKVDIQRGVIRPNKRALNKTKGSKNYVNWGLKAAEIAFLLTFKERHTFFYIESGGDIGQANTYGQYGFTNQDGSWKVVVRISMEDFLNTHANGSIVHDGDRFLMEAAKLLNVRIQDGYGFLEYYTDISTGYPLSEIRDRINGIARSNNYGYQITETGEVERESLN